MNFLTELLREYGRPYESYSGLGTLESRSATTEVSFVAAQLAEGEVLLACQGDVTGIPVFIEEPVRFSGRCADGTEISADGSFVDLELLSNPREESGAWAVYRVGRMHVSLPPQGPPSRISYLITNYEFDRSTRGERVELELPGVDSSLFLDPVKDRFAEGRLRTLREAHPTAILSIDPFKSPTNSRRLADTLCYLLSIGRGTKVQWIQEQLFNSHGELIHVFHLNRVTKRFSSLAPIDPRHPPTTPEFLKNTYATALKNWDTFKLPNGTVDSVLDAKAEGDYLETRGAKLAVALETLKTNVMATFESSVDLIIPPPEFENLLPGLADSIATFLSTKNLAPDTRKAFISEKRLYQLNRRSFAHLLRKVANNLQLKISSQDLDLVVRCRNSLVHRGDYYCATATDRERSEIPPHPDRFTEYLFLVNFMDRFLLRLVDYRGPYVIRTSGGRHTANL